MFRNSFQKGFLSVFSSYGRNPLLVWDTTVKNGHIKRITDEDTKSLCLEMIGRNVTTCYMTAPAAPCQSLGIKLPYMTIVMKNLHKYFSFEVQIIDDSGQLRRFRGSNFQAKLSKSNFHVSFPVNMCHGWNEINLDLADYTQKAYGTNYFETVRIEIHANCRLQHIYFADRLYPEEERPTEYRIIKEPAIKPINRRVPKKPLLEEKVETVRPCTPVTEDVNSVVTSNQQ